MNHIYINNGTDSLAMTYDLMRAAHISKYISPSMHVIIKPNLAVARPADSGATTHPQVVEGIIRYLRDNAILHITVAEGSWIGDSTKRAWDVCGYSSLEKKYGVQLLDTKDDPAVICKAEEFSIQVCRSLLEADYVINVPVLKGHCQTELTCCLKNLKGCIPDSEKRRFHTLGLHKPIAALNTILRPQLHIVDGICGDLSFEEGGNPIQSNRMLLGFDPVLLDSYGAQLIGYQAEKISYLRYAQQLGVGHFVNADTHFTELNSEKRPVQQISDMGAAQQYKVYIREENACSACYAALIYALHQSRKMPSLPLCIGQAFRGRVQDGIGIGNCASGCELYVPGCPPRATDIVSILGKT